MVFAVHEQAAGAVPLAGEQVVEVVFVVAMLGNGVVDICAVDGEPCHLHGCGGNEI